MKGHWEDQRPQFLQWIRKEGRPTEDDWRRLLEWVRAMIRHRRLDTVSRMLSTLVYGDLEHRWTLDPAFPPFLQQCQREVFASYHGVLKLV
ncbi:MAG: hypothetical protein Q8P67_01805 [archaeon]|nr:hypothetical protein [archaeon]